MERGDFEKEGDPEAEWGVGKPRFARATVASGLNLGGEDGRWSGESGPEVILSGG